MRFVVAVGFCCTVFASAGGASEPGWQRSYVAGYRDDAGAWAGGSEIMHLAGHGGRLYAANGYWVDSRWEIPPDEEKQSAQVLRLDAAGARWQVDLDAGRSNGLGLRYMKGNILRSLAFTRDADGRPLPEPQRLLFFAAGATIERGGAVSAWTHDDHTGRWAHELVRHGSNAGGVRWVPRDVEVHRDAVTGVERVFLLLGNPGVLTGVYDPASPTRIRWSRHIEFPFPERGSFETRPLGLARANGSLFLAVGGSVYRRIDGEQPRWTEVLHLGYDADTDVGGVRGLTTVDNPAGPGESLLFLWIPNGRSKGGLVRLDPDGEGGYVRRDEANLVDLMAAHLGTRVTSPLGGHNRLYPVTHPRTGETVHLVGMQAAIHGRDQLRWTGSRYYAGGLYAVRSGDGTYTMHEVDNAFAPGRTPLVAPRAFAMSPFGDGHVYVGGHDSNFRISDNHAWVHTAPLDVVLGLRKGGNAPQAPPRPSPEPRLTKGPLYEWRIYHAAEGRYEHLVQRFREHTDRLFRKHGLEAVGYWRPLGTDARPRTFVYLLKHPSRYDAWTNWKAFTLDREWEAVLDTPRFQRLLVEKPTSLFAVPTASSPVPEKAKPAAGGVYELRTHTAVAGRLANLAKLLDDAKPSAADHGIERLALGRAFDRPESATTLYELVHHANPDAAERNRTAFEADPRWQRMVRKAEADGPVQASEPTSTMLAPWDFSPLR